MLKKILLQIFLIISVIVISILFYFKYFDKRDQADQNMEEIVELEIIKGNVINDISYKSQDFEGREYLIESEKGLVSNDNPNLIEMENVRANIILIDGSNITINSDNAIYDNIKHDTKFNKNIKIKYLDHTIKSDDLVLYFEKSQIEIFNNLTYKNLDLIMSAEKIILDLKSMNIKIFNFDETKIKIQNSKWH